jgi:hypothetical protein
MTLTFVQTGRGLQVQLHAPQDQFTDLAANPFDDFNTVSERHVVFCWCTDGLSGHASAAFAANDRD